MKRTVDRNTAQAPEKGAKWPAEQGMFADPIGLQAQCPHTQNADWKIPVTGVERPNDDEFFFAGQFRFELPAQ